MSGWQWLKPSSGEAKAAKSNGFVGNVTDKLLEECVHRNQAGHAIVVDVASDAVDDFECLSPEGAAIPEFDTPAQILFNDMITVPITQALMFTRMHGYCGVLIGYKDGNISSPARETAEIEYIQPIPKSWIDKIVLVEEKGNVVLPLTVESYEVSIGSQKTVIDASRIIMMSNISLDIGSVVGESSLMCVYDDVTMLKSMDWGVGQAMWRHGGGLTAFVVPESRDQQSQIDAIADLTIDINAMTTLTLPYGTDMITESNMGLNPEPYYNVILQQIALGTRIPVSILVGGQAGSLTASMKDRKDYYELLDDVQSDVLTPALTELFKRLQLSNQLPDTEFAIEWDKAPDWIIDKGDDTLNGAQTTDV